VFRFDQLRAREQLMMQRVKRPAWVAAVMFGTLTLFFGCGKGDSKHQTEYVEGVVTLDGDPVPGATVTFTPVKEGEGVPATGTTDDSGRYTLTTVGGGVAGKAGAGTVAGEYHVGVVKTTSPPGPEDENDPNYEKQPDEGQQPKITHVVPQKYNNPRKSGLKATVQTGKNDIPIELKSR
jgi:hypothetical protein